MAAVSLVVLRAPELGRLSRLRALVQRLWSDVSAVRPRDRSPVEEEALEVVHVLERLEY